MAMNPNPDRNKNYMKEVWGTSSLITDYWSLEAPDNERNMNSRMLREINNDDMTPKKHDFSVQKEIHEKIRNDNDYDDWEYGTEPIFG
jgi:hypothetical protein